MITEVQIQDTGFKTNDGFVPNDTSNRHYQEVQRWLLGKTPDWLLLEQTFNEETLAQANWVDIQNYEADYAQYLLDKAVYDDWKWSQADPIRPPEPEFVPKPEGYYTQEEVDASVAEHDEWQIGYDSWVADTIHDTPYTYWVAEPKVLLRPIDISEPTITPLPAPVPNVPDPSLTEVEYIQNKRNIIKTDFEASCTQGFICTSGRKFDANVGDIAKLDNEYQLSQDSGENNTIVRDFTNTQQNVTLPELAKDIKELRVNYRLLIRNKWSNQDAADSTGYIQFVQDELNNL